MKEPRRLLGSDATEFERLLLGAASREQPSHGQRRRMRRALIMAELGFLTTTAKAIASLANHVVVVAVVASTIAGSSASGPVLGNIWQADHVASPAPRLQKDDAVAHPDHIGSIARTEAPDAAMEELLLLSEKPPESKLEARARAEANQRRPSDLREEIALMDQARTALRSGAPTRTLAVLEQYRSRFPRGSFGQEATALRIEALAASGHRTKAIAEATAFLRKQPNSPHAERLRLLVSSGAASPR